jgi:hypothetical protein
MQRIIVAPVAYVRSADTLGWVQSMGGNRAAARNLDSAIARALDDRGLAQRWVMPPALVRAHERNRSYAADPYALGMEPLRSANFVSGSKFGEPLSSQLRTMIALEADVRMVLLPIEVRFDQTRAGMRATLRAAFVDPRTAEARWVGEVKSEGATSPAAAFSAIGQRLADLFAAP